MTPFTPTVEPDPPYRDRRVKQTARKFEPFALSLRGGRTGSLIQITHYATLEEATVAYERARALYEEHNGV